MFEVRNLSASYGQHRALEGASLRVDRGEIVVILGANGAGKSTLLKAISGICEGHVSGSIKLDGHELVGETPDRIVEHGIALVPEGRGIFADLNVEENLQLGSYAPRARDSAALGLERVYDLFPKLRERRHQAVRTMSGGEQQMVAIGRAMMSNPAFLTLDEPSLGLSPLLCKELFQNLRAVRETGIGILLVEQNARASLAIAERGYLLENAHVTHEDSADKLARDPAVQKAYLGGSPKSQKAGPFVPTEPRAPAGPNPSDIAAAAMKAFVKPSSQIEQPEVSPPKPQHVAKSQIAPMLPPSAVPSPAKSTSNGIDINSMVAHAQNSAKRPNDTPIISGRTRTPPSRSIPMPDISGGNDRLKSILGEIEDAAKNARNRTPYSGRNGRKPT